VGRAGIEPATRGLLTTLAFTSHKIILCCSLDWLITRSRSCWGVRRTVSEGFFVKLNKQKLPADNPIFKIFTSERAYLKLSGCPSIQPHFHFIVTNKGSHFIEQESAALPTELTTQSEKIITGRICIVQAYFKFQKIKASISNLANYLFT